MQKRRISIITTGLLIVMIVFCPCGCAEDQNQALMKASEEGNWEDVKRLLNEETDINTKGTYGRTALIAASLNGHGEVVKVLLDKGADINAKGYDGWTALIAASYKGQAEVVEILLAKGADFDAKGADGWTPLMSASFKGHAEIVKVLLAKGADVNAKAKDGSTALRLASLMNHPDVVKLLKAHGALSDAPLMQAVSMNPADISSIVLLLIVAFALYLLSRIAGTRRMGWVFLCLGFAVWSVVLSWFMQRNNDEASGALIGFLIISDAVSDLIARPILRRRITPPCVRVRRTPVYKIVFWIALIAFGILLVIVSFRSPGMRLFSGLVIASMIIELVLILSERVEVCGAGVWQYGWLRRWDEYGLRPWDKYESFCWKGKMKDSFELRLVSKSWGSERLLVAPEDREAVQQLLEANLPDRTNKDEFEKLGLPPRSR